MPVFFDQSAKKSPGDVPSWNSLRRSISVLALVLASTALAPIAVAANSAEVTRAEGMIWADSAEAAPEEGRRILEQAADSGDVSAQRVLGAHLVYGWVFEKDIGRGISLLKAAAQTGDPKAQTQLGEVLLFGFAGVYDRAEARRLLETASAAGEPEALRVLGEQLVRGGIFAKDVEKGRQMLEAAVAQKDTAAMVTLGKLYLDADGLGRDRATALALFEQAAAEGDGRGLAAYGSDMMWREIDASAAEKILNRAGELGAVGAYVTLAHGAMYGYLGGGSVSRAKYDGYVDKAHEAKAGKLAVLAAERKLWGIGERANGPDALSVLTTGADAGDAAAAKYLIALLRDGNNLNVRRSATAAQEALERYKSLLSPKEAAQYALTLQAANARQPNAYESVRQTYEAQPELFSEWFGTEMYKANPNIAIYILQTRLKEKGLYGGTANGLAGRSTLSAMYEECIASLRPALCNDSVMRPDVIGALLAKP